MRERADIVPTPADLLADPALALDLPLPEAAAMLARVGALEAVLRCRLVTPAAANGRQPESADRLLTPGEVGERAGLSVKQVYRRAKAWPFTRRPSPGTLRFSERGLERWMAGRRS